MGLASMIQDLWESQASGGKTWSISSGTSPMCGQPSHAPGMSVWSLYEQTLDTDQLQQFPSMRIRAMQGILVPGKV